MRLIILLAVLSVAAAVPQNGGFFGNIRNQFFGRPRPRRPPPPQQGPPQQGPPPQGQQQPPLRQAPPPQNQFRPQPRPQRPQPPRRPVQGRPPPQNRPPPNERPRNNQGFGNTQLGVPQGAVQGVRNVQQNQPIQNQIQPAQTKPGCTPGLISKQLKNCPGSCPNHEWEGNQYIITWIVDDNRCSNFTGHEAEDYCKLQGGHAVSLDTTPKALHFIDVAIKHARRYFWTGGRIDHGAGVVTWPSGNREGYVRGQRFWSHTGGKKPEPEPQPDNRDGNEFCIGVLNNFYADGVKWHDVACHHRKPTICELD